MSEKIQISNVDPTVESLEYRCEDAETIRSLIQNFWKTMDLYRKIVLGKNPVDKDQLRFDDVRHSASVTDEFSIDGHTISRHFRENDTDDPTLGEKNAYHTIMSREGQKRMSLTKIDCFDDPLMNMWEASADGYVDADHPWDYSVSVRDAMTWGDEEVDFDRLKYPYDARPREEQQIFADLAVDHFMKLMNRMKEEIAARASSFLKTQTHSITEDLEQLGIPFSIEE
tara:strand:+ start:171 stop:851 length:681 start_codon:yes stop_codon:yes gene_type:complete